MKRIGHWLSENEYVSESNIKQKRAFQFEMRACLDFEK